MIANGTSKPLSHRVASLLERHSGRFLLAIAAVTALLVVPVVLMPPTENASDNPGGFVFDLQDKIEELMPPRTHNTFFIIETPDGTGNVLTQPVLQELLENGNRLREADASGELTPPNVDTRPLLYNGFDTDRQVPIVGIFTIADAVDQVLREHPLLGTSLAEATEDQVKFAVHFVLSDQRTEELGDFLSQLATSIPETALGHDIDVWTSPGLFFTVVADNPSLGGGGLRIGATAGDVTIGKEQFNRNVQTILRGEERTYRLWGVAIDASLEIEDEVATAVPFIVATFLMVLAVVGISLRSVRVVGLTALGLVSMIIWLKGLSNLIGLESSTTLDFIVPIAMISLGADFVIHSVHRYRQEYHRGVAPRIALRLGMGGVLGALTLAMALVSFAMFHFVGIRHQGWRYFKHFNPGPLYMSPMLVPLEVVGSFVKAFALAVRLFANMVGGHLIVAAMFSIIYMFGSWYVAGGVVLACVALMFLELFVAFLQAYVFTMLTVLFIAMGAVHHDDGHEDGERHHLLDGRLKEADNHRGEHRGEQIDQKPGKAEPGGVHDGAVKIVGPDAAETHDVLFMLLLDHVDDSR